RRSDADRETSDHGSIGVAGGAGAASSRRTDTRVRRRPRRRSLAAGRIKGAGSEVRVASVHASHGGGAQSGSETYHRAHPGRTANDRVLRSFGLGLDEKAMEAVAKKKFRPGYKDGRPVTVQAQVEVNFRLL